MVTVKMKKIKIILLLIFITIRMTSQVGTLTGTGMSICNLYSFSICPNQTITPYDYGNQGYSCTGQSMPDVSFNINGPVWRVMKLNWNFTANVDGQINGYTSSGSFQTIPFLASNTITPLNYSGSFVQFAINGVASGLLIDQSTFSITINSALHTSNSYTFCPNISNNISISPTVPPQGGPWTYTWQPGNLTGNSINVNPSSNTIYTVTTKSPAGCISSCTVEVNVNCPSPQLCSGNLGFPIFYEDFGSGVALYGPPLPAGETNYTYQTGNPPNGSYVISSSSNPSGVNLGYVADHDHTGNLNGYMMVVNSDYAPSEVYRRHVTGLCQNTTYVFSAYLSNNNTPTTPNTVCPGYVYANVKFQIEYPLSTIQNSVTTGNLPLGLSNTALNWQQYGFVFTTLPGQTSVDVVLINNAPGGCGNDYVVDDISLSPCGPGVVLDIVPNQTVFCLGDNLNIQSSYTSGSYVNPQYQWQFSNDGGNSWSNISGATSQNYYISNLTPSQVGLYQLVIAENGNIYNSSCSIIAGPISFTVSNISVLPSSTLICSGNSTTLTASGASSYTWSTGDSGPSIVVTPTASGTYTVTGVNSSGSCLSTAMASVQVIPHPTISISPTLASVCKGSNITFTATGASTYSWSPQAIFSSTNGAISSAIFNNDQVITVIGSVGSCTSISTSSVYTIPLPTLSVSNNTVCEGNISSAMATGADSYTWSPTSVFNLQTGATATFIPVSNQTYTVYGVDNTTGCIGQQIFASNSIPNPTVSLVSNSSVICLNQNTTIKASGANSYTWAPASSLSSSNGSMVIASPISTTIYSVTGTTGTFPVECLSTNTIQITVISSLSVNISPDIFICEGSSGILYASGGNTYSWSPSTWISNPSDSVVQVFPTTTTVYSVNVTNNGMCATTSTIMVNVYPMPIINAGHDTIIPISDYITLNGTGNVPVGFISGSNYTLDCNYCSSITVRPMSNTCYTLTGIDEHNCQAIDEICIKVDKDWEIYVPNTFTPNEDNLNDYFLPVGYGIEYFNMSIYDRWGERIYKEEKATQGWDGKKGGKMCEQGVYVYQLEIQTYKGAIVYKTGHVNLLPKIK